MDQVIARTMPPEAVDLGPLSESLGFLLRMAQLRSFEHFFSELSDFALKPGEFSVLTLILRNSGIRQGVLAQRLMIKRAHMTKLIRSLEARGYVERTIPDEDRRSVTLTLTAEGKRTVERHWERFVSHERSYRGPLSESEKRQLIDLLQAFVGLGTEKAA